MKRPEFLTFTHLTTKRRVTITTALVYAIMPSDALGGTFVLGTGGAIVPVLASPEEVEALVYGSLTEASPNKKEGARNGIQKRR